MIVINKKDKTNNSWAIRVPTNDDKPKNLDFIFTGPKSKIVCEYKESQLKLNN